MIPEIKVDARQAYARFSPSGIPMQVQNNLRRLLPDLGKTVGAAVEQKLDSQLKTRRTLTVEKEMRETTTAIVMRIAVTSPTAKGLLPKFLEEGTAAHWIRAVNKPFLVFFSEKAGHWVRKKEVWHPGFKGLFYMEAVLAEQEANIVDVLTRAVKEGAAQSP